ncbi:MAG: hypothetical protein LBM59_02715 [Ruminococcus sp.]|jgi:hypothetical protein|nr:hypothetical protein [Ruminococcus sp.]
MLIYKCDYCGAEIHFDGSNTTCPACGAKLKTGASPIDTDTYDYDDEPVAVVETIAAPPKKKKAVSTVVGILAFLGAFFIFLIVVAFVENAKETINSEGSYYLNDPYKEEGHKAGEEYAGDIILSMDVSDYSIISWTEEPKLVWSDYDALKISGKIHNNSDRDIRSLTFGCSIVWKDADMETKYYSASVYNLFAGQDELVDENLWIYLPMTYDDVTEIKLTSVDINYEY